MASSLAAFPPWLSVYILTLHRIVLNTLPGCFFVFLHKFFFNFRFEKPTLLGSTRVVLGFRRKILIKYSQNVNYILFLFFLIWYFSWSHLLLCWQTSSVWKHFFDHLQCLIGVLFKRRCHVIKIIYYDIYDIC